MLTSNISRKELIKRSARLFHDKPAQVYEGKSLSFKEVDERANRLANALIGLGLKPRDRVATMMRNCLEYAESEFAMVKGSFPQIPMNPRLTPQEQLFQLNETETKVLILQHHYLDVVKPIEKELKNLKIVVFGGKEPGMLDYEELRASASPDEPEGELNPEDTGEVRYTSGTTGVPKGILLPHWSRLAITRNFLMEHMADFTSDDRFVALQPFYHGAGWFILPAWVRGGTNYIVPRYDPEIAFDLIEKEKITVIKTVPTVLIRLLDAPDIKKRDLSSVKTIIYGGSPMPVERLKEAMKIFGPVFLNLYGQMEAAMTISLLRKDEHTPEHLGSVGRPCVFVNVKVVDDNGNELSPGETGEVIINGDHQMIGYMNRPEATAETIRDGWIHTNDLGMKDKDGYLYLSGGRKSEMIISGGLNVYPTEVEQVLYRHPAVSEAGVIGIPDPVWGEAVKACVVLKAGQKATEEEIIAICKENLAGYKRPKSVDFLKELPHNAAGKIVYGELRKLYKK
ncbi:MAG: long-chain fatty acid--CoA ligase [Chloroflexota bacterium]